MDFIQILGLIIAVPLGLGIGFCVMQSWTSLVLAIINLIGFVRGKRERSYTALGFGTAIIQSIVFSGILFLINYLLQHTFLIYTYSKLGQILLFIFLGIQVIFMILQVPHKLRIFWLNANYDKSELFEMELRNSEKIII
ncbi:MAG: hypothetical protein A2167_02125 [Planctomycetes bacterium RBG_13_46_10]|nr:MAG: hypothetical protein A2167_02125 [Planctomycetes bacterium RBG_13_46_10]